MSEDPQHHLNTSRRFDSTLEMTGRIEIRNEASPSSANPVGDLLEPLPQSLSVLLSGADAPNGSEKSSLFADKQQSGCSVGYAADSDL